MDSWTKFFHYILCSLHKRTYKKENQWTALFSYLQTKNVSSINSFDQITQSRNTVRKETVQGSTRKEMSYWYHQNTYLWPATSIPGRTRIYITCYSVNRPVSFVAFSPFVSIFRGTRNHSPHVSRSTRLWALANTKRWLCTLNLLNHNY